MYINIGKNVILNENKIVGIFNIQNLYDGINKNFIEKFQEKDIKNTSNGIAKSLILYIKNNEEKIVLSSISSFSLGKNKKIIN